MTSSSCYANEESCKTNFRTETIRPNPHQVRVILETKGYLWLTEEQFAKYQVMLLDTPEVIIKPCTTLNPTSLIHTGPQVSHSCKQVISQTYASRQNISDLPFQDPEEVQSTDGSSFVQGRQGKADYTPVGSQQVTETKPLPQRPLLKEQCK